MRLLGGFAFDRARGKPVTLDIGFGPFKTRVIGPKDLDAEALQNDWSVDLERTEGADLAVVVVSGIVKATGQAVGVSSSNSCIVLACQTRLSHHVLISLQYRKHESC